MNAIRRFRRFAAVLAGLAAALVSFSAAPRETAGPAPRIGS